MDLARELGAERHVFALDDGVLLAGRSFTFLSIEDVAKNCLPLVLGIASKFAKGNRGMNEIVLAGWSYGGVVAVEVAKLLRSKEGVHVKSLFLFDSPLRKPVVDSESSSDDDHAFATETHSGDVSDVSKTHFDNCTRLLELFHGRSPEIKPLICPIFDIRPTSSKYSGDSRSVEELTTGVVRYESVCGTHWTMLFGENAISVSKIILQQIE